MFAKILVALDQSAAGKDVLSAAGDLAEGSKGEVRVVHVHETSLGMGGPILPEKVAEAEQLVQDAVKSLQDRGISASGVTRQTHTGRVAAEIVDESKSWDADTIVLATTGMTALKGLVIGSVTHKVLHLTHLPVLVVR